MANAFTPQELTAGKLLCGKNFPNFVRTWNWLVRFCRNLQGDAQGGADGAITVDRADEDHPIVRLTKTFSTSGGGATYVKGDDTNIVFTPKDDGTIAIDVYYV